MQGNRLRVGRIMNGCLGLKDLVDPLHRSQAFLDGIDRFAQILGRIDDAVKDDQIIDKGRCIDGTVIAQNERTTIPKYDGNGSCSEKFTHGMRHLLTTIDSIGHVAESIVRLFKTFLNLTLCIECLDDTQTAQGLFDLAHQKAPLLLSFERFPFQFLADLSHDIASDGQQDQHEECQLPTDRDHTHQIDQDQDRILEQHVQGAHDGGLDLIHIA